MKLKRKMTKEYNKDVKKKDKEIIKLKTLNETLEKCNIDLQ